MEVSASQMILATIPPGGISYLRLKALLPGMTREQLDGALLGLRAGRLATILVVNERGFWFRTDAMPPQEPVEPLKPRSGLSSTPRPKKPVKSAVGAHRAIQPRYDAQGRRLCSRRRHYVPLDNFARGSCADGLHAWCRSCRRIHMAAMRAASKAA